MSTFEHCPNKLVHSGPLQKGYIVPKIELRQQCSVSGISFLIICFFSTLPRILPFSNSARSAAGTFLSFSPLFICSTTKWTLHCATFSGPNHVGDPPTLFSKPVFFIPGPTFIYHIRLNCQGAQSTLCNYI